MHLLIKKIRNRAQFFWNRIFCTKTSKNDLLTQKHCRQRSQFDRPLNLESISSFAAYAAYHEKMESEYANRTNRENQLIGDQQGFFTPGFCYVCSKNVDFFSNFAHAFLNADARKIPNWREHMVCPHCHLNNRMRGAIQVFEQLCEAKLDDNIYLTEQKTPLYQWFQQNYLKVIGSEYLANTVPYGSLDKDRIRNETLTGLTFETNTFDYILSFDVFEHIPEYQVAFQETLRCLKPRGKLIFTVPFNRGSDNSIVRARLASDGTIEHILPPEYHGDPLNSKGVLCFYHFGWELLDQLCEIGFSSATAYLYWSEELGYLGFEQILFVAQKGDAEKMLS